MSYASEARPLPFAVRVGERLHSAHVELADQWLRRLHELLDVPANSVFPTAVLLDHIPDLIGQIALDLASPAEQAIIANTAVVAKAQELGELRFQQRASVHQLQREYQLLAEVLNGFVIAEVERLGLEANVAEALAVAARLHDAVFLLMQTTVNTLVARYAETVARQTTQLEGFNRMVSHELRQPLGTIRSAVEVLRCEDTPAQTRDRCLELIETSSRRMATLTTRLLTLSSVDIDSIQTQETDLARLVDDAVVQLREMAEHRGVELSARVPQIRIVTDPACIELILVNLLSNAIKYIDPERAAPTAEVSAVLDGEHVLLSVRDNGLGIPADQIDRVFEGFYRAHAARDSELGTDGVGLGLAIVAECVRRIGATIDVDSNEGEGTTVRVRLPVNCTSSATQAGRG